MDEHPARRVGASGLALLSIIILLSSASQFSRGEVPEDLYSGVTTLIAPYAQYPRVSVDGAVTTGEYDQNVSYEAADTGISLLMIHDNDSLFLAVTGPAWSWVAIGFSSDNAETMGFVVVAKTGSGFVAQELEAAAVSDVINLQPTVPDHMAAIDEFGATTSGGNSTVELKLSLSSSIWTLQTGIIYPSVFASNLTAAQGFPTVITGEEAHFVGGYLLRPSDDVKNVNDLLNGSTSPVPSLVAAALLGIGIIAIFWEFVVRRRKA